MKRNSSGHISHLKTTRVRRGIDKCCHGRRALANQRCEAATPVEAAQLELAPVGELEPRA